MLKTHCLSDLGRVFLPNDESGDKSNHKRLSVYLKFMFKLRQLLNFSIAAACSSYCDLESVGKRVGKAL